MRARIKAELIAGALERGEPSEAVSQDPELRELERLASLLAVVSRSEPEPSREALARMRERVEECQRGVAEERRARERDPARRVQVAEPWRASYGMLTAAAVLAAVLVVSSVLLTGPGMVIVPPALELAEAEAWVFATAGVEIRPPGGEWSQVSPPFVMQAGSSLRIPRGVRAEVAFGGRDLARLESGSEADVVAVAETGISVQLRQGRGYFRAEGTPLRVFGGGLQAEARGTVFDLDLRGPDPVLLALEDEVAVEILQGGTGSLVVAEGEVFALPDLLGEGDPAALVGETGPERLLDEWLLWNRLIDRQRGWSVGVLSDVEGSVAGWPAIAELGSDDGRQPAPAPPPDGDGGEDGQDGGQDGEERKPTLSLQGTVQGSGVALSWEVRDGTAQEFILLRAEGREPAYPGDVLARLAGGARSYLDSRVEPGVSYIYRVAVRYGGGIVYSNGVRLSIPAVKPAIALSGRVIDGGGGRPVIELTWHVDGDPRAESHVLVRGLGEQNPQYPPFGNMLSWSFPAGSSDYKYIDDDLYMGYTYNYRIYAVRDGNVVLQSNLVSVYVDTSVLLKGGEAAGSSGSR
ncbi:MAG: hypothetical protein H5T74_08835 [Actinobacteria bacterium]|nr:hypothetical protein [Actinomycetota bacterium]